MAQAYPIKRSDLVAALDAVKGAVPKKSITPILTHVLFEDASVFGFDSEVGIKVRLEFPPELKFNLPFERFSNLVRQLNEPDVAFEVQDKRIQLICGRHKSVMQQIVEDQFPSPQIKMEDLHDWRTVPAGFKESLEKALLAASTREQEKTLSAVMVRGNKIMSTNRTQLVRCMLDSPLQEQPILLGRKAVQEIIRLGNPIKMMVTGPWALWDYGNLTLYTRLREGANEFPDIERLFDTLKPEAKELVPDGLAGILTRLKLFHDEFTVRPGFGNTELVSVGETSTATEVIDTMELAGPKKFPAEPLIAALPYAEQMNWMAQNQPLFLKGQNFEYMMTPCIGGV